MVPYETNSGRYTRDGFSTKRNSLDKCNCHLDNPYKYLFLEIHNGGSLFVILEKNFYSFAYI